jgi:hypothetical protein
VKDPPLSYSGGGSRSELAVGDQAASDIEVHVVKVESATYLAVAFGAFEDSGAIQHFVGLVDIGNPFTSAEITSELPTSLIGQGELTIGEREHHDSSIEFPLRTRWDGRL